MSIKSEPFGTMTDGTEITKFTLTNKNGVKAGIINYGGIIVSLETPDRNGNMADIVLGYDKLKDYLSNPPYLGATIGRYANRLEKSSFELNGLIYHLSSNEGQNQLHGGPHGFDKKIWDARILSDDKNDSLELSLFSPEGDEGYPGNLEVRVVYRLTDSDALEIDYYGACDSDTVLNMTNHSYFNLSGHDSGTILDHVLQIHADFYTPANSELLPTGEILSVKNTPFDFTCPRSVSEGLLNHTENEQLKMCKGYDHNFVLNVSGNQPEECCRLYDPNSGRVLKVLTTKPGIQFYTGNYLQETGKGGAAYGQWSGLCLETQFFPNSMKYRHFPSPVLRAGHTYHHTTIFQFGTEKEC